MPDPWNHLPDYAALEARLAAPSADLPSELSSAGLDGIALARLRTRWNARFAGDRKLEDGFEAAFEAERDAQRPSPAPAAAPVEAAPVAPVAPFVLRQTSTPIDSPWIENRQPMPARPSVDARKTSLAAPIAPASALPFGAEASREFVEAMSAPTAPKPRHEGSGTALAPASSEAGPALPFADGAEAVPPNVATLTLEQYASLAAELAVQSAERPSTLSRYGLAGEDDLRLLHRVWGKRFKEQPELRASWVALVSRYGEWLRGGAPR